MENILVMGFDLETSGVSVHLDRPVQLGLVTVSYTHLDVYKRQFSLPLVLLIALHTTIVTDAARASCSGIRCV